MPLRVTVGHPYIRVEIATEMGGLALLTDLAISSENFDGDILSFNTVRDMGQDCPTFSLSVVYRRDWYTMIGSNDLIVIKIHRPPENMDTVMVGLVDDVRKTVDLSSGKPVRAFNITGRSINKALINFSIGAIKEAQMEGLDIMEGMMDKFLGSPPAEIISEVVNYYMDKGINYSFANGNNLRNYFSILPITDYSSGEICEDYSNYLTYQGGLWEFLKDIKNPPFNEMYWEILNEKETLVIRPTPFDQGAWESLGAVVIKDYDIISENLGRSDLETYVVFKVDADTMSEEYTSMIMPLWHPPFFSKYGLNRLAVYTKYATRNPETICMRKQEQIFNWNIKNNIMENGTLKVKGSVLYKVGTRIFLDSTGIEYYLEAVTHSFTLFEGWTTTLSLTRGLYPEMRFSAPWGSGVQMTLSDVSGIMGYDISSAAASSTMNNVGTNSPQAGGDQSGASTQVQLTGSPNYDLVNIALGEVGTSQSSGAHKKYGGSQDAWWCCYFATWCAKQAGVDVPYKGGYCDSFVESSIKQGKWAPKGSGYTPKPGDFIFFKTNNNRNYATHIGIVSKVENGVVYTVEGNTGGKSGARFVKEKSYELSNSKISGYHST